MGGWFQGEELGHGLLKMDGRLFVSPVLPKPGDASQMGETLVLGMRVGESSRSGEMGGRIVPVNPGSFDQSWSRLVESG